MQDFSDLTKKELVSLAKSKVDKYSILRTSGDSKDPQKHLVQKFVEMLDNGHWSPNEVVELFTTGQLNGMDIESIINSLGEYEDRSELVDSLYDTVCVLYSELNRYDVANTHLGNLNREVAQSETLWSLVRELSLNEYCLQVLDPSLPDSGKFKKTLRILLAEIDLLEYLSRAVAPTERVRSYRFISICRDEDEYDDCNEEESGYYTDEDEGKDKDMKASCGDILSQIAQAVFGNKMK